MTALHGRTVLALGLLAACGQVLKPADPDRRLDVHMTGGMFEVGTGYRVVVLPEPASSVLRLIVRYPVGGADDPPGKAGLAHVVAHVLEAEKSVELGRLALAWNAVTEADATTYEVTAVPGALDELLGLEVAHLAPGCAGVAPESFERARQAVLGELRQRDGAAAQLQEVIREQAYPPGHPYRAVATADSVANVTLPDACAFLAGPYQRGTVTVVASGAVDEPALRAVAAQRFGKLAERAPSTRPAVAPVVAQHARARAPGPVDEPTLVVTWPLPQANTRDYRLLSMLWRAIPYDLAAASLQGPTGRHEELRTMPACASPRAPCAVAASSMRIVASTPSCAAIGAAAAIHACSRDAR